MFAEEGHHCSLLIFTTESSFEIGDRIKKLCHAMVYHALFVLLLNIIAHTLDAEPSTSYIPSEIARMPSCTNLRLALYFPTVSA